MVIINIKNSRRTRGELVVNFTWIPRVIRELCLVGKGFFLPPLCLSAYNPDSACWNPRAHWHSVSNVSFLEQVSERSGDQTQNFRLWGKKLIFCRKLVWWRGGGCTLITMVSEKMYISCVWICRGGRGVTCCGAWMMNERITISTTWPLTRPGLTYWAFVHWRLKGSWA